MPWIVADQRRAVHPDGCQRRHIRVGVRRSHAMLALQHFAANALTLTCRMLYWAAQEDSLAESRDRRTQPRMNQHPFLQRLTERPLLADGAMGTMLYAKGASSEQCLEQLVLSRPGWVTEIHQAYATAGADVIKTHTFGANRVRLAAFGLADQVRELNFRAVKLVRDVREVTGRAIFIAGDIGPLGKRLLPDGPLSTAEAQAAVHEQVNVLWEAGADLLLFETFTDLNELETRRPGGAPGLRPAHRGLHHLCRRWVDRRRSDAGCGGSAAAQAPGWMWSA